VSELKGAQVPEGRLKPRGSSAVPSGLIVVPGPVPNVKTLGYYRMSLRDNGFARTTAATDPMPSIREQFGCVEVAIRQLYECYFQEALE